MDASLARLFVAVTMSNMLVTVSAATGTAEDTTVVGESPQGVCVNPLTDRVYVANNGSSSISVVRGSTGDLLHTIPLTWEPLDVAVNTQTNKVYATAWFGMLYAINGATSSVVDSVVLSGFYEPQHVAVSEQHNRVYVAALNCNVVWVVEGASLTVTNVPVMPDYPDELCVNETVGHVYVCTGQSLTVLGPDGSIVESVSLGRLGAGCACSEADSLIYVGCPSDGSAVILWDGERMLLTGQLTADELVLDWTAWPGVSAYWVYGADNSAYFPPGLTVPYQHRLAVLLPMVTTWSSPNGVGDLDHNWTYLIVAVDASQQEMTRSNRFGEHDFGADPP